jgi:hypothetical protein
MYSTISPSVAFGGRSSDVDAERGEWERSRGPATSGELLKALMEDPLFAWLRPFSGLMWRSTRRWRATQL